MTADNLHDRGLVDARTFRESMARVCAPVTIVTTLTADGVPYGTTVSAFASLSLDPPMVSVSLDNKSNILARVTDAGRLSVNVLSTEQRSIAKTFARTGGDKFAGVQWSVKERLPHLGGVSTWLACEVIRLVEGGDHTIVLAAVRHAEFSDLLPLVYARHVFGTHDELARGQRCA
ncbi:flavin reductase family protein [Nocardia sp. NPDC051900]|uniref:flavin reductase family protein n=1 Tax=Nocardia sp. NPDC051900 TaxID=3364326 RepID=UPI0037B35FB3